MNTKEVSQRDSINRSEMLQESKKNFREIAFVSGGNDPSWNLKIDFEKGISFSAQDVLVLNTPPVMGTRAMDFDVTFYHAKTEAGELRITISGEKCIDPSTGQGSDYLTRIEARYSSEEEFRSFSGCGRYIFD